LASRGCPELFVPSRLPLTQFTVGSKQGGVCSRRVLNA
jgi:hypothetical protein